MTYKLMHFDHDQFGNPCYYPIAEFDNLVDVREEIKKQIRKGCPELRLFVFKKVDFEVICGVKFGEESV